MRRYLVPGVVTCVAVALLAVLGFGVANEGTNGSIENEIARGQDPATPDASARLPLLENSGTLALQSLRGKVVLVNVFASWCQPCQQEAPVVEQAQRMLQRHGGTVVGITYEDNASADRSFVRQFHITFPVVRDVNGDFVQSLGLSGVPDSFVIDRSGRIKAFELLPLTTKWIDSILPRILAEHT